VGGSACTKSANHSTSIIPPEQWKRSLVPAVATPGTYSLLDVHRSRNAKEIHEAFLDFEISDRDKKMPLSLFICQQ